MTTTKFFQIRDKNTHIPVMVTRVSDDVREMKWAGYQAPTVFVTKLNNLETHFGPHDWSDKRTMFNAHNYIQTFFTELKDGQVVDVEFILKETKVVKELE